MNAEKKEIIGKLVADFKASEGKDATAYEVQVLKMRLDGFSVDELNILLAEVKSENTTA